VQKYRTVGHSTDDNMARAHSMLDTDSYKHSLTIYNIYSSSNATMVARTCLSVTFIRTLPVLLSLNLLARQVTSNFKMFKKESKLKELSAFIQAVRVN